MSATLLDFDFETRAGSFHCPVCGAPILVPDEEIQGCPHLLFAWIGDICEFIEELTHPDIAALLEETDEDEDDDEVRTPLDESFLAGCPRHTVVFALTESGIACGPVSSTLALGIKFPD